jgi:hypothetical protein
MMMKHQDFYHFMLRENTPESPRLPWLAETILAPMVGRVLPQIRLAQEAGEFPPIEPVLFHYMTIGIASVLTALAREIFLIAGISINDPGVAESYLEMAESVIFDRGSEHYSSRPCSVELTASPVGENRDENDASGLSYIEELRAENARLKRLLVESLLDKEKQKESDRLRSRDLYSPRNYITQNPD